jgi:hypothetical protein
MTKGAVSRGAWAATRERLRMQGKVCQPRQQNKLQDGEAGQGHKRTLKKQKKTRFNFKNTITGEMKPSEV